MINILIPTDFSNLSKVAIRYAIRFANKIDASITLLHVVSLVQPARASMRLRLKSVEQDLVDAAEEDIAELVAEFQKHSKTDSPIQTRVVKAPYFNEAVKKEAKRLRSGLIIMGTRGATGLKKYVVGTNTASVIDVSSLPVLVIPELAEFKNFTKVVYATDLMHTEKELKILIPYFMKFESIVHLVHVTSSLKGVSDIEKRIDAIVEKAGYKNVIVRVMVNKNVDEAIQHYVDSIKADILATFTHQYGFYEKLFDRSLTRKLAFQSKLPLLAFKHK